MLPKSGDGNIHFLQKDYRSIQGQEKQEDSIGIVKKITTRNLPAKILKEKYANPEDAGFGSLVPDCTKTGVTFLPKNHTKRKICSTKYKGRDNKSKLTVTDFSFVLTEG